jgi:hypothetical protein
VFTRQPHFLTALCGIIGPVILVASFVISPAPPASYTITPLRDFALQHHNGIALGGWLQGIGSLLIVLFAIALVHLADATHRLAGWITLLAGTIILMVSLVEVRFYLGAVQATEIGDTASALSSNNLISSCTKAPRDRWSFSVLRTCHPHKKRYGMRFRPESCGLPSRL